MAGYCDRADASTVVLNSATPKHRATAIGHHPGARTHTERGKNKGKG